MRLLIGFLIAVSIASALPVQASAQGSSVSLLLLACQRGNASACNAALPIFGNACQRGQQQACGLHNAIRARRQNGRTAEANDDRALHQRCFSGDAGACKRLQEGPQRENNSGRQFDIPGLSR
ncbi:hypothetical protein [Paracraurococcus ruber]|uniref:hypothetical protein n=1 Tax=Paracraurococcus ruber TaxID=77675 RepID=UPI001058094B|nr:hypothetical protein [Paracraurococcus ruber]TDG29486.1 hypothetical protein E2C05_17715 [Paracraurococcus ruber]